MVVDAMFPMACFVQAMREFQAAFPTVQTRLYVETLGAAAAMVLDGRVDLGLILQFASPAEGLVSQPVLSVELVPVAAPDHPLAALTGPLEPEVVRDHVQLVLTDRSELTAGRDHGVLAVQTWRLADLGAKHAMLIAGLGWGGMPRHLVQADLEAGRLVMLDLARWDGVERVPRATIVAARRTDRPPGPAARWMHDRLAHSPSEEQIIEQMRHPRCGSAPAPLAPSGVCS